MRHKVSIIVAFAALAAFAIPGAGVAQSTTGPGAQLGRLGAVLTVMQARTAGDLTVFPLAMTEVRDKTSYLPLDRAVASNKVRITEWGSGTVPSLKIANKGKSKVFIMAGEIMTGAKQDRMSANDALLGPRTAGVKLPVYCVEQGRWVKKSERFAAGGTAGTMKLRKSAVGKKSQSKIWSDVAEKSRESGVRSATGAMQAVYNDPAVRRRIASYEKQLADVATGKENVVGYVAVNKGQIASADIFANPGLFAALWQKLLKAAATDAVTSVALTGDAQPAPTRDDVVAFLDDGITGSFKRSANPGLGAEFLIEGRNGVTGSTLVTQDSIVHMALFGTDKPAGPRELKGNARYRSSGGGKSSYGDNSHSGKGSIGNGGPPPWYYEKKYGKKGGKKGKPSDQNQAPQSPSKKKSKSKKSKGQKSEK